MTHLFNSRGQHILNEHGGYLSLPSGQVVGRYVEQYGVFVDLTGRYIGEILCMNRIVCDSNSRYRDTVLAAANSGGNVGAHPCPGNDSPIPLPPGLEDIDLGQLTQAS